MGRPPVNAFKHVGCSSQGEMLMLFPASFPRCCSVERLSMNPPPPSHTSKLECGVEEDGASRTTEAHVEELDFADRMSSSQMSKQTNGRSNAQVLVFQMMISREKDDQRTVHFLFRLFAPKYWVKFRGHPGYEERS